jgi:transcriptional regulator with XRE-family HTH domain
VTKVAKDASPSPLPRRQLGRYLRKGREDIGLTLKQVSTEMEWSLSKLARIERGEMGKLTTRDIEALCKILEFDDERTKAMIGLNQQSATKSWWHAYGDVIPEGFNVYVGLETSAVAMDIFRPDIIPGLCQTADYARALDRIFFPNDSEEEQRGRIELRMSRQAILTRRTSPPKVDVVLHESVLHTQVGDSEVMAGQLRHLADMSTRDNVSVRILPSSAGFPLGIPVGPYVILDFPDDNEPTVVYIENFTGDAYLEGESDVARYREASAIIQHAALDAVSSRSLLRRVARQRRDD